MKKANTEDSRRNYVAIATDYAKEPLIYVPIMGKIAGPFIVERPYVNFGVVPLGMPLIAP